MGFSENASKRALKANGNNCEPALNWLFSKAGDPSLELPLDSNNNKSSDSQFDP